MAKTLVYDRGAATLVETRISSPPLNHLIPPSLSTVLRRGVPTLSQPTKGANSPLGDTEVSESRRADASKSPRKPTIHPRGKLGSRFSRILTRRA